MVLESTPKPAPAERPGIFESSVIALNPETKEHLDMARAFDSASQDAYNPEEPDSHATMDDPQLKKWMAGDRRHMARFLVVKPEEYDSFVDRGIFDKEVAALRDTTGKNEESIKIDNERAEGLLNMRELGVVGETYIYNDTDRYLNDRRLAQKIRELQNLPGNTEVCAINPWYVPGTKDASVESGVRQTLTQFLDTRVRQTTAVYFADSADVKDTHWEEKGTRLRLTDIAEGSPALQSATEAYQDLRVLEKIGFQYAGERIRYAEDSQYLDIPVVMTAKAKTVV